MRPCPLLLFFKSKHEIDDIACDSLNNPIALATVTGSVTFSTPPVDLLLLSLVYTCAYFEMVVWRTYLKALHHFPYLTGGATTSLLMGAGDVIAQKVIEERKELDFARTRRFLILGAFYFGPVCTKWYRVLDRVVPQLRLPKQYHGLAKMVS